ncbi:hypothetical protein [Nostoc sp.]|uniref:hypothetical protein n=1 Tax=Nostoc sp. TaxID=1180 RepID=UPI002FF92BDB
MIPGKIYKVTTTEGEPLGDWTYSEHTGDAWIFYLASIPGTAKITVENTSIEGLRFS